LLVIDGGLFHRRRWRTHVWKFPRVVSITFFGDPKVIYLVEDEISESLILLTYFPLTLGFQMLSNGAGGPYKKQTKAPRKGPSSPVGIV
jgi:hypothetical protein